MQLQREEQLKIEQEVYMASITRKNEGERSEDYLDPSGIGASESQEPSHQGHTGQTSEAPQISDALFSEQ